MNVQFSPGRLYLLFLFMHVPNFQPVQAAFPAPFLSISTDRPVVVSVGGLSATETAKLQRTDPYIESFRIHSDIQFRYSRTKVQSVVVNPSANQSHEVVFNMTLPDTAFISKFSMTIKNETWTAMVKKQDEAEKAYKEAVSAGKSAGLVETRSANVFTVKRNVEASESIIFTLTYEELLQRRFDVYEQIIHIDSDEVNTADMYSVIVTVTDNQNIELLRAIGRQDGDGNDEQLANVKVRLDGNTGLMTWSPGNTSTTTAEMPKRIALQYDVRHHPGAGQVVVRDGHFVHFLGGEPVSLLM